MLPDGVRGWVLVGVQVEVRVLRQHQGRLGLWRDSIHGYLPGRARDGVGHRGRNVSDHAEGGVGGVSDVEGDAVCCQGRDVPEAVGPVVRARMESVVSIVHFGVVGCVVDCVLGVTDAVDVAARDGIVNWMTRVDGWTSVSEGI